MSSVREPTSEWDGLFPPLSIFKEKKSLGEKPWE